MLDRNICINEICYEEISSFYIIQTVLYILKSYIIKTKKFLKELLQTGINNYFGFKIFYSLFNTVTLKTVAEKQKKIIFVFFFVLSCVLPKNY